MTLIKNNPSFQDDDDLIKSFVVRQELLAFILEVLEENTERPNEPPHHVLIVGPRGSGKTTLVHRVAAEVRSQAHKYGTWYPITFSEEPYGVSSPGEFWLEAIFHVYDQTGEDRWRKIHEELRAERDEKRLNDRALAQLFQFAKESGKRFLIVAENLNMLLGEQMNQDDGWTLRHTLQNSAQIMLLGTATVRFQEIDDLDKAWFELLAVRTLDPLTEAQCGVLWQSVAQREVGPRHLRAIEILTGGNPRLIKVLAGFFVDRSFRELMEQLVRLIDDHTEYFKSLLDGLAPKERKVFSALLDAWDPVSARSLADATRLSPSETSALLNRLVARGAVLANDESPRRKTYQAAERLFNIYYLMRRRGHPANRVRAVVDLMVNFYDAPDLIVATRKMAVELRSASSQERDDYLALLQDVYKRMPEPRTKRDLISCIDPEVFGGAGMPSSLKSLWDESRYDCPSLRMPAPQGHGRHATTVHNLWDRACAILARPYRHRDPETIRGLVSDLTGVLRRPWQLTAVLGECLGELEEADSARREFHAALRIEPKNEWVQAHLARLEMNDGNLLLAESVLRAVVAEHDSYGWAGRTLSDVLVKEGKLGDAEEVLKLVLAKDDRDVIAYASLGAMHEETMRYSEAEAAYRRAIAIDRTYARAWVGLGRLLHEKLGRLAEAEESCRRAIAVDPENPWAYVALGEVLEKLNRPAEAEESYRNAVSIRPHHAYPWVLLGKLLDEKLGRSAEAEEMYRKALSINANAAWAWAQLAELLHRKLKRYGEAEDAYRKLISIRPDSDWAWAHLGELLDNKLDRYDEAEEAYRKLISVVPDSDWAWAQLGDLLYEKLNRYAEAEEAYRKGLSINANYAWAWSQLGDLLYERLNRYTEAEEAYRKAISIEPDDAWVWAQLGRLLHEELHRDSDAEAAYRRALVDENMDLCWLWFHLGRLLHSQRTRYVEAKDAYERSVAAATDQPVSDVLSHLAILSLDMGDRDGARTAFDKAAEAWIKEFQSGKSKPGSYEFSVTFAYALAGGMGGSLLRSIQQSEIAEAVEPIVAAMQLLDGAAPQVAAEILEVGRDISKAVLNGVRRLRREGIHDWLDDTLPEQS